MEVLKIFFQKSPFFYFFILILGGVNSVLNSGLLVFINNTLAGKSVTYLSKYDWVVFASMVVVSFCINWAFQTYMLRMTNRIVVEFELSVLERLRKASLEYYEKLGGERVLTAINDTAVMSNMPMFLVNTFTSVVTVVCCLGYLFYISFWGGLSIMALIFGLLTLYMLRNQKIMMELNRIRDLKNDYYRYLNDLLYGFKEVKMSFTRSENIYNSYLKRNKTESAGLELGTALKYINNELSGKYSLYILLGFVLFGLPKLISLDYGQVTSYIVTLLYLLGPVTLLINVLPYFSNLNIALFRLHQFNEALNVPEINKNHSYYKPGKSGKFELLELEDIGYLYTIDKEKKEFELGPLNVKFNKGEVVFITGGNGSGKSTFLNLVAGLYAPRKGNLLLNGEKITELSYPYYRNHISVIFSNHYLFNENYDGFNLKDADSPLTSYTRMLQMEDVIRENASGNYFSGKLSRGQQKRLSLIYALLEDREVLILDEWAAEQDPGFKAHFYTALLPELKNMGKTIIAVTHDDEYFNCADRIIHFNSGRITSDEYLANRMKQEPVHE